MIDLILQFGISNACFSLALAVVAAVVGVTTKRPHLAYLLWLLVFVKLVTPPVVAIPIDTILKQPNSAVVEMKQSQSLLVKAGNSEIGAVGPQPWDATQMPDGAISASMFNQVWTGMLDHGRTLIPPLWLLGSLFVFIWSLVHVIRFNRLLALESAAAPEELQAAAARIARNLEMRSVPAVYTTTARLSPMVWWVASSVRVVIPAKLLEQMDAEQWQWILAHELAHVRRRDYLVRWLEWLACVLFWWNPVVWWAQRNLRAMEEICCDALVMSSLKPQPRSYANSLLTAVEFLAYPALRPPAMASEINSGGFFMRRCKMIVSKTPNRVNSLWLKGLVLLFAIVVLPLGTVLSAKDSDAKKEKPVAGTVENETAEADAYLKKAEHKLQESVAAGKLTKEEAEAKLEAVAMTMYADDCEKAMDDARIKATWAKLEMAVANGKISSKEAEKKMDTLKKEIEFKAQQSAKDDDEFFINWERQLTLYFEGYASRAEITKEIIALEQALIPDLADWAETEDYAVVLKKLQAEVEAGRMTTGEAIDRMLTYELGNYAYACEQAEFDFYLKETWAHLQMKVTAGNLTPEEAEAKMADIEKQIKADAKEEQMKPKKAKTSEKKAEEEQQKKQQAREEQKKKEK